jgi:hypothetical protein
VSASQTPASNAKTFTLAAAVAGAVGLVGGLVLHAPVHSGATPLSTQGQAASSTPQARQSQPSQQLQAPSGNGFTSDDNNGGDDGGVVFGGRAQPGSGFASPQTSSHGS